MKRKNGSMWLAAVLLGAGALGVAGCDDSVADDLAALSADYVGQVASVVTTHYLQLALNIDNAGEESDGG